MLIIGRISQPGCCSMIYELSKTNTTISLGMTGSMTLATDEPTSKTITSKINVYKWFNPLIIFLRVFDCCFKKIDSFKINGKIFYCFKSDIIKAGRTFAGVEGDLVNRSLTFTNNNGVDYLEVFVSNLASTLKTPDVGGDDDDFGEE